MNVSFDTKSIHSSPNGQVWRGEASIQGHKVTIEVQAKGITKESAELKMKEAIKQMASDITSKEDKTFEWEGVKLRKEEESAQEVKKKPSRPAPPSPHVTKLLNQITEMRTKEETFHTGLEILGSCLKLTIDEMKNKGQSPSKELQEYANGVAQLATESTKVIQKLKEMDQTAKVADKLSKFNTIFSENQISSYYDTTVKIVSQQEAVQKELVDFFRDNPQSQSKVDDAVRAKSVKPSDNYSNYVILPAQRLPRILMLIDGTKRSAESAKVLESIDLDEMNKNIALVQEKLQEIEKKPHVDIASSHAPQAASADRSKVQEAERKQPGRLRRIFNKILPFRKK